VLLTPSPNCKSESLLLFSGNVPDFFRLGWGRRKIFRLVFEKLVQDFIVNRVPFRLVASTLIVAFSEDESFGF
jgi:hypothetical protein